MRTNEAEIKRMIMLGVVKEMASRNQYYIPIAVSNRHVHLCTKDAETLFGRGHSLSSMKDLSQPGQYACAEQITLAGPKGSIEKIRVLGPFRSQTQLEFSVTDAYRIGIEPVVRMSGNIEDTPGAKLIGPAGEVTLSGGVIVAKRHVHISNEQAKWFGVSDGEHINLRQEGERPIVFENVLIRCGDTHSLEMHIDTDEANAGMIKTGMLLKMIK